MTTRLAIDHLRLARVRRETYPGPWLPGPVVEDAAARAEAGTTRLRRRDGAVGLELVAVNGQPGRILRGPGGPDVWDVLAIDVAGGRIQAVRIVRNPHKLRHLCEPGKGATAAP